MSIEGLLDRVRDTRSCRVLPATGLPDGRAGVDLPDDVRHLYALCGGLVLFAGADYSWTISGPSQLVPTNDELGIPGTGEDRSDRWYVIARLTGDSSWPLSIDLDRGRLGRCYDSFHETHAVAGSSPVIARSFEELLTGLLADGGGYPYWLQAGFRAYGDAYDGQSDDAW